jgi:CRP-like cAMP-binding protein
MSPKDARTLRDEAAETTAAGKWKRTLAYYLELERTEPGDPQWPKRAAELYRRLGKQRDAVAAYDRAADRYVSGGFAVQAIAVAKVILQIDPDHAKTRQRLAAMSEAPPPRGRTTPATPAMLGQPASAWPGPAGDFDFDLEQPSSPMIRPSMAPIMLAHGAALDKVPLGEVMPGARQRTRDDGSSSGIVIIPLDDELSGVHGGILPALTLEDRLVPDDALGDAPQILEPDGDVPFEELSVEDLIEMAELPAPRVVSVAARRALAETPLFSELPPRALEALIERSEIIQLGGREILFREGDGGDALYVVTEGEVTVIAEGPPRVEVARLGPGSFFGEISLVTDSPRSATIVARGPTEVMAFDRAAISPLLAEHPEILREVLRFVRDRLIDRLLHTSPMFAPLPDAERANLAARFAFLEIEPGAVLVAQGSRADGLYVLLAGAATVERDGKAMSRLGPGDLAGMTPLVDTAPAQATVRAETKCLALQLAAPAFREIIMTHPHVLEYVSDQLDARRREATERGEADSGPDLHLDLL